MRVTHFIFFLHLSSGSQGTPSVVEQKTYYVSLKVENKLDKGIILKWEENGKEKTIPVPQTAVATYTSEFLGTAGPVPLQITGVETGTENRILINGMETLEILPSMEKEEKTLLISSKQSQETTKVKPGAQTYYINLSVTNNAGKKVTLVWSENDSPKTRDIENGQSLNLTKTIQALPEELPSYEFQVHEYGTQTNLLINGERSFTLVPSDDADSVSYIVISASGMFQVLFCKIMHSLNKEKSNFN